LAEHQPAYALLYLNVFHIRLTVRLMPFADRADAGRRLAQRLTSYAHRHDVVVLALPRGGVPVGFHVARELGVPLDVFVVRKLGVPGHPELAMGAIASGGVRVLSEDLIDELGIPRTAVEQVSVRERLELERREILYRGNRTLPPIEQRTVILIDDGVATGASMEAAVAAMRQLRPAAVVVASPVGAIESCGRLRRVADAVVCLETPEPFQAVGLWYRQFDQTTDHEVVELLRQSSAFPGSPASDAREDALASADDGGLPATDAMRSNPLDGRRSSASARDTARPPAHHVSAVDIVRTRAQRLSGGAHDYDALMDAIGDAGFVLIGEATHGTHEFYRERARITQRLIVDQGFSAVAAEADWRDANRVNRYVRGQSDDSSAVEALDDFGRFPVWMWRNTDVLDFVSWLRAHNDTVPPDARAGFYGLDLYSLRTSIEAVLRYLDRVDPNAAARARVRYGCFDQFSDAPQTYGNETEFGMTPTCEREVVAQLVDMQRLRTERPARGADAAEEFFQGEQNARLVKSAEEYYRSMFRGRQESWNLRDRHMADTLEHLATFLSARSDRPRIVVWAHNSHLGDARVTEMGDRGELNVGQLIRERAGTDAVLIGLTTHEGTVTAASGWDQPPERKFVRSSLPGSYEHLLHETGIERMLLPLRDDLVLAGAVSESRLERAIGVIYLPRSERTSHYFLSRLASQFDFVLHIDCTSAVEPLERSVGWETGEPAEAFPSGF
jgi:erythromycin esterase-like protein/predicted phosphoribosyltransferase